MKTTELREMSEEQLRLTIKESSENLFRLRLQAQTERLDVPSELRRNRRWSVARRVANVVSSTMAFGRSI